MPSRLVNRSILAPHGRTSMRLEPETWDALNEMLEREGMTLAAALRVAEDMQAAGELTSAVRVLLINYYREAATQKGHCIAGHGALEGGLK